MNVEMHPNDILSKVIGWKVVINIETIAAIIDCPRFGNCYFCGWDEIYATIGTIECTFYGMNFKKEYVDK